MKFPAMNKRPRQAVVIPDLQGGLNLRDSVSMINDNQLTDCKNMWFRDGVLKTRPAIASTKFYEMPQGFYDEHTNAHDIYTEKQFADDNGNVKNETCRLFSQYMLNKDEINFYWVGETYFERLPAVNAYKYDNPKMNYFVVQHNGYLYCFWEWAIEKYNPKTNSWGTVELTDIYSPIISTNNLPLNDDNTNPSEATMLEPYNMIGNHYRMVFSTVDKNRDSNKMRYKLLHEINDHDGNWNLAGCKIIAKIDYGDKVAIHEIEIIGNQFSETEEGYNDVDDYQMRIAGSILEFYHKDNPNVVATANKSEYILNNMTITAPYHTTSKENIEGGFYRYSLVDNETKVLNMSHCTWFGGDSAGINGGTRLFLGGNTEEPNLVVWSDLNNPLYFPENNYFYVGESSSAVTAFGKQSDMLVIFKNNETYYTQYNRNTNISADNLIDQSVIDYVGSSVYFPLTLIHSAIGCDCPDTVQLCRNRLVWASSDGKIYTLVTNNQYSERNIYEIGEMIGRKLKEDKELKTAHSTDWNGYYLLQSGSRVYVLDYNSYGYQYISSYSKTEDANLRIPWYYWDFELTQGKPVPSIIAAVDGGLKIINNSGYGIFVGEIAEDGATDNMLIADPPTTAEFRENEVPINCFLQTKLFEFGAQGYLKNVDKVVLSLGNNDGAPILAEFVTNEGCEEEYITLDGEDTKAYSAGYIKSVPMRPSIRAVERFGVKLSCDGPLAVDGITLFYRVLGGAK